VLAKPRQQAISVVLVSAREFNCVVSFSKRILAHPTRRVSHRPRLFLRHHNLLERVYDVRRGRVYVHLALHQDLVQDFVDVGGRVVNHHGDVLLGQLHPQRPHHLLRHPDQIIVVATAECLLLLLAVLLLLLVVVVQWSTTKMHHDLLLLRAVGSLRDARQYLKVPTGSSRVPKRHPGVLTAMRLVMKRVGW
jgi:hypothetical protein